MSWTARTIGLILLWSHPAVLSAQLDSYPNPGAPTSEVAPAAYQQPSDSQRNASLVEAAPLPITPRADTPSGENGKRSGGVQSLLTMGGSLVIVLGVFFLLAWLLRRASPGGSATLPVEAFEVLGRAALANRQQAHLLRCGNKLLLVSLSPGGGASTLTEIADPAEVERLATLCRQSQATGHAATLRQVFRRAENHDA